MSKFYAVKRGRIPGIYMTWKECQNQVEGFKNNRYKSFETVEEAEAWIRLSDEKDINSTETHLISKDNGGKKYALKTPFKIVTKVNWKEIIQAIKESSEIKIITYTINLAFVWELLNNTKAKITIILSTDTASADYYKSKIENMSSEVVVKLKEKTHAKIIVANSGFIYLGSQNVGFDSGFQACILMKDHIIYEEYNQIIDNLMMGLTLPTVKIKNKNRNVDYPQNKKSSASFEYFTFNPEIIINRGTEVKIAKSLNWNQKLNGYHNRKIIIATLTLPGKEYVETILTKLLDHGNKVEIIAGVTSKDRLVYFKKKFPSLKYTVLPNIHAKFILIENDSQNKQGYVWLSSQNFGTSGWFENTINLKSNSVVKYLLGQLDEVKRQSINISGDSNQAF